jgi:hypothetical protein
MSEPLLGAAGRRRSPATLSGFHAGRPPRNKGMRYPADPSTFEEIVAVMRSAGEKIHGERLRVYLQGIDNAEIIEPCTPAERRWSPCVRRASADAAALLVAQGSGAGYDPVDGA